ncbi:hypothetical protein ACQ4M4_18010 [Leptolyngbya sp. AN02str]|uniref:hypothetical protein n=1 Tax=Leptolyngbya sp. AN02str TaxID=3423363 RepID=UPI003D31C667
MSSKGLSEFRSVIWLVELHLNNPIIDWVAIERLLNDALAITETGIHPDRDVDEIPGYWPMIADVLNEAFAEIEGLD